MISVAEARNLLKSTIGILAPVRCRLQDACGLVLAEDVYAGISLPPFQQSGMDGYAFCYSDYLTAKEFFICGEVAAGDNSEPALVQGGAARIFTGAPLPAWTDTVVMQEKTSTINKKLIVLDEELWQGSNVRNKGSEINRGALAVQTGTVLTPATMGFLAGLGIIEIMVHPKPSVHILVTGNELQEAGEPLQRGQVYESNSVMLKAALQQLGVANVSVSKVRDDIRLLQAEIKASLQNVDLLLITGGVSVGDYDFVVKACEGCGVKGLFHRVAQRPGKPLYAGMKEEKVVFGLPGNPASVLSCFYNYVVTALEMLTGRRSLLERKGLPLLHPFSKKNSLAQFLKAVYSPDGVTPSTGQESFRLHSFSAANCLIALPEEARDYAAGDMVETILLPYL